MENAHLDQVLIAQPLKVATKNASPNAPRVAMAYAPPVSAKPRPVAPRIAALKQVAPKKEKWLTRHGTLSARLLVAPTLV
jgi:hypothetical protein